MGSEKGHLCIIKVIQTSPPTSSSPVYLLSLLYRLNILVMSQLYFQFQKNL